LAAARAAFGFSLGLRWVRFGQRGAPAPSCEAAERTGPHDLFHQNRGVRTAALRKE